MKNALLLYVSHIRNMPLIYDIHKGSRRSQNSVSDMTFRNMVVSQGGEREIVSSPLKPLLRDQSL
jgi:hypothetical protein